MGRGFTKISNSINILVVCSLIFSIFLLIWNSNRSVPEDLNEVQESYVLQSRKVIAEKFGDATYVKFHTTFHYNDPLTKYSSGNFNSKELELVKDELHQSKLVVKDLKNRASNPHSRCDDTGVSKCQILHIAIVCAGYKETRRVATLVKSVLFYRQNPLHFHFISDSGGRHVLDVLFRTWNLKDVKVSFYDCDVLKTEVDWIPNSHYSGIYGLMKLTLTKALPEVLEKVIVLDTDVFFLTDIAGLWKLFDDFTDAQAIALVENQSEWYTGRLFKKYKPWPALGKGFNSGVMLFHLKKLREIQWPHLWRLTAEKQLINLFATSLADQDVINAALKDNPTLVFRLPCVWNVQLSHYTQSENCYTDVNQLKIIHWNNQKKKIILKHRDGGYFKNMYLTFLQYDGNLLRDKGSHCPFAGEENEDNTGEKLIPLDGENKLDEAQPCYEFQLEANLRRRVHLFYFDYNYIPVENDVTLLVHLSMDRIQILISLIQNWQGPMSVALYASDADAQRFLRYSEQFDVIKNRKNIGVHVVFKDGDLYPVNYLRNIALEQVQTKYVFLCDIDFLPKLTLYEDLKHVTSKTDMHKKALIVPAFETYQYKLDFPDTKIQLISQLESGKLETFRFSVWPQGHAATDFNQWKKANENYKVEWQQDFEPYIVVERKSLPLYDMRFLGFGWNKVSHIMELYASGYSFEVVHDGYIIHMPHAPSFDITKYRTNTNYRRCLRLRKEEFRREIENRYKIKFI